MNQNVKIVGRRLYLPSLIAVALLEVAELFFCLIFHTSVSLLTGCLLAKLHPSNLVNTIFYLVF